MIFTIHLHMHQQTWESTVLVLTLFPLFSPYARRFSKQTDKKNAYRAVFVVSAILNITLNICILQQGLSAVQTSKPTSKARGVLLFCNVSYCVSYRDTVSGYVSYRGETYHCRPMYHQPVLQGMLFLYQGNLITKFCQF